ncbi:hypothetical protein ACFL0I_01960 [Gemmatimonadota bacterium]
MYFFSCSCGSRVFFDHPGYPWPLHADSCLPYLVRAYHATGASVEAIVRLINEEAEARGVPPPLNLIAEIRKEARPPGAHPLCVEVEPGSGREFVGGVLAVNRNINFYKRFNLPRNDVSKALLGALGRTPYSQVLIREEQADDRGIKAEVTAYLPTLEVDRTGLRIGHRVLVGIEPFSPPGRNPVWIVTEILVRG